MNMQLLFDKLSLVDRLRNAGIVDDHARAIADGLEQAFREEVATKNDLNDVKTELKTEISNVKTELKAEIAGLRSDMELGFARVDTKFAQMDTKFAQMDTKITQSEKAVGDRLRTYLIFGFGAIGVLMTVIHFIKT